jgi:hypothetical protein
VISSGDRSSAAIEVISPQGSLLVKPLHQTATPLPAGAGRWTGFSYAIDGQPDGSAIRVQVFADADVDG